MTNPLKPAPNRSWAAGYVHRALQVARDEDVTPIQVQEAVQRLAWFVPSEPEQADCAGGAESAGSDVRTLPDGQREYVLLKAPNYHTAGTVLTMYTARGEQAQLMEEFCRVVAGRAGLSGARPLVDRIEKQWRTGVRAPDSAVETAPAAPPETGETPTIAEIGTAAPPPPHPFAPDITPVAREVDAFSSAPPELPLPDPVWLEPIVRATGGKVKKGAASDPTSREAHAKQTWAAIAGWLDAMTSRSLGPEWKAKPHQWQNSGNFNTYYWGKIFPAGHPLRDFFNVGVQIAHVPQWIDEFDHDLSHLRNTPVLAVWATTNDNLIQAYHSRHPAFAANAIETYWQVQQAALSTAPELWLDGGALVRWYRPKRGDTMEWGNGISHLTTVRTYLDGVRTGALPLTGTLWSPLLPLTEVMADPRRGAELTYNYLRVFGGVIADVYRAIEPLPGPE